MHKLLTNINLVITGLAKDHSTIVMIRGVTSVKTQSSRWIIIRFSVSIVASLDILLVNARSQWAKATPKHYCQFRKMGLIQVSLGEVDQENITLMIIFPKRSSISSSKVSISSVNIYNLDSDMSFIHDMYKHITPLTKSCMYRCSTLAHLTVFINQVHTIDSLSSRAYFSDPIRIILPILWLMCPGGLLMDVNSSLNWSCPCSSHT